MEELKKKRHKREGKMTDTDNLEDDSQKSEWRSWYKYRPGAFGTKPKAWSCRGSAHAWVYALRNRYFPVKNQYNPNSLSPASCISLSGPSCKRSVPKYLLHQTLVSPLEAPSFRSATGPWPFSKRAKGKGTSRYIEEWGSCTIPTHSLLVQQNRWLTSVQRQITQ